MALYIWIKMADLMGVHAHAFINMSANPEPWCSDSAGLQTGRFRVWISACSHSVSLSKTLPSCFPWARSVNGYQFNCMNWRGSLQWTSIPSRGLLQKPGSSGSD
jgi:hypothetical protein